MEKIKFELTRESLETLLLVTSCSFMWDLGDEEAEALAKLSDELADVLLEYQA